MENLDPSLLDHDHTLVNLSNAILSHYGVIPFHSPLSEILSLFKGHRKIALFLFDGLGESPLKRNGKAAKDFLSHAFGTILSVNPATTVAATTALLTAKFPIETGYLGWSLYFEELGYPLDVFPNTRSGTGEEAPIKDYMGHVCPTKKIDVLLKEAGIKAKLLFPHSIEENGPKSPKEEFEAASSFFDEGGEFLYCYFPEPDHTMHEKGVVHSKVRKIIRSMGKMVRRFAKEHPDVLVLTLADHGMVDTILRDISAYPHLKECLYRPLTFEGRTVNFFVKNEKKKEFKTEFKRLFPSFLLLDREEALAKGYFGEGEPSAYSLSFIGDYLALSYESELLLDSGSKAVHLTKGHHAGITLEERKILLCAWNK